MSLIGLLRTLERITRPPRRHDEGRDDFHNVTAVRQDDSSTSYQCVCGNISASREGACVEDWRHDGAEQLAEREAQTECLVPEDFNAACRCVACVAEEHAAEDELAADDDTPNPYEPSLSDDELVGVRGLLQERYGDPCTCPSWGNPSWPHRHGCPADVPAPSAAGTSSPEVSGHSPVPPSGERSRYDELGGGPW